MHFRKPLMLLILTIFSSASFAQKYKGDNWANIKSAGSGTLTVVYIEQYGLVYKDKNGKMKGVCVDILTDFVKYIKDKYGKTLTVNYAGEEPDFATFLKITKNTPGVLGVTNTTITE